MKIVLSLAVLTALVGLEQATTCRAAGEEGVAVAIIYDTSGSMHDAVRDSSGHSSPKYIIANRALEAVARQIQAFASSTSGSTPGRSRPACSCSTGIVRERPSSSGHLMPLRWSSLPGTSQPRAATRRWATP